MFSDWIRTVWEKVLRDVERRTHSKGTVIMAPTKQRTLRGKLGSDQGSERFAHDILYGLPVQESVEEIYS